MYRIIGSEPCQPIEENTHFPNRHGWMFYHQCISCSKTFSLLWHQDWKVCPYCQAPWKLAVCRPSHIQKWAWNKYGGWATSDIITKTLGLKLKPEPKAKPVILIEYRVEGFNDWLESGKADNRRTAYRLWKEELECHKDSIMQITYRLTWNGRTVLTRSVG